MSGILSKVRRGLDGSSLGFRIAACDLGEALALLRGGVQPDAETLSRLCISLQDVRGFLVLEAEAQRYREQIAEHMGAMCNALDPRSRVSVAMPEVIHARA